MTVQIVQIIFKPTHYDVIYFLKILQSCTAIIIKSNLLLKNGRKSLQRLEEPNGYKKLETQLRNSTCASISQTVLNNIPSFWAFFHFEHFLIHKVTHHKRIKNVLNVSKKLDNIYSMWRYKTAKIDHLYMAGKKYTINVKCNNSTEALKRK